MAKVRLKYACLLSVVLVSCVAAIHIYQKDSLDYFIKLFSEEKFVLEGNLVFDGEEKIQICPVTEEHNGENYRIEYPDKSFESKNGNLYIDDELVVMRSLSEQKEIQDMFDRESVISNLCFADLELASEYNEEIPEIPGSNSMIECICKEYRPKGASDESVSLRLFFEDESLFALRAREDSRFTFYVNDIRLILLIC